MRSRPRYLLVAALLGGFYGVLLGAMTVFAFPSGLGLGLGWLCGHLHTLHWLHSTPDWKLWSRPLRQKQLQRRRPALHADCAEG